MKQHRIIVQKTARYFTSADPGDSIDHVVFVCHGYMQLANDFLEEFEEVFKPQTLFVAPEGLHRFYRKISSNEVVASWMTREDREDDIRDYVAFLDAVYAEVMQKIKPGAKISVLGFSQGGATASRWISSGKVKADELILFCSFLPPDMPATGIPAATKLTVVTASNDTFISPEKEQEQLEKMKLLKPDLKHTRFEGEHAIHLPTIRQLFN